MYSVSVSHGCAARESALGGQWQRPCSESHSHTPPRMIVRAGRRSSHNSGRSYSLRLWDRPPSNTPSTAVAHSRPEATTVPPQAARRQRSFHPPPGCSCSVSGHKTGAGTAATVATAATAGPGERPPVRRTGLQGVADRMSDVALAVERAAATTPGALPHGSSRTLWRSSVSAPRRLTLLPQAKSARCRR